MIIGSREQLLHLLAEAAEIEHTLMCSYLYAAFSLKRRGEQDLNADEGAAVERWRKAIMDVAVEEMGHLLMVANLTVAVGGRPHFARPNFPISPGYFPSGVVVRLTPFSTETVEHFIFLERPQGVEEPDGASFDHLGYRREQAVQRLMPGAQDYATIGRLYDAILQNLHALAHALGEDRLFIGPASGQVSHDLAELDGVAVIEGLAAAKAAIATIVEQGEGARAERDVSHYRTFKAILAELQTLRARRPDFEPAWPAAENPVLRRPLSPEDRVWVDAPDAADLLDFACAAYGLLLRILVQAFGRPAGSHAGQKPLIEGAFVLMHAVGEAGGRLARTAASSEGEGVTAGMSFTMLRGVEPLAIGRPEAVILREQADALAAGAQRLGLDCAAELSRLAGDFRLAAAED